MLEDLNERAISLDEEIIEALNEIKSGKALGLDGFPVDCVKKCGMAVLEWLVRLLNVSFDTWGCTYRLVWVVHMCPCTKGRMTNVNVATQKVLVC